MAFPHYPKSNHEEASVCPSKHWHTAGLDPGCGFQEQQGRKECRGGLSSLDHLPTLTLLLCPYSSPHLSHFPGTLPLLVSPLNQIRSPSASPFLTGSLCPSMGLTKAQAEEK
jgi:hypothetical protein